MEAAAKTPVRTTPPPPAPPRAATLLPELPAASPRVLSPPHPWDLRKNNTTHRQVQKGEPPHKTSVAQPLFYRSESAVNRPSLPLVKMAALGGDAPSPAAAGCPASLDHSRAALDARRGLTHCRCGAANQKAQLFPANHCRGALANQSVLAERSGASRLGSAN